MRLIVGISGSSGVIYGIRMLEMLKSMPDIETHLIISSGARLNIALETGWAVKEVEALATVVHSDKDLAASVSSGSFQTDVMVIVPCVLTRATTPLRARPHFALANERVREELGGPVRKREASISAPDRIGTADGAGRPRRTRRELAKT